MFKRQKDRLALIALVVFVFMSWSPIDGPLKRKVTDFFFGCSTSSTIQAIRTQLGGDTNFTVFEDPNRDPETSVVGEIKEYKYLNKVAIRNQLIITVAPHSSKNKEVLNFTLLVYYKLEDLPSVLVDYDNYKSEFKPYFGSSSVSQEVGFEKEEIESMTLKTGTTELEVKLTKGYNLSHAISVAYRETRTKKK